jgi:hypothetical protein
VPDRNHHRRGTLNDCPGNWLSIEHPQSCIGSAAAGHDNHFDSRITLEFLNGLNEISNRRLALD